LTRSDPLPAQDELDAFYAAEYRKAYKGVLVPKRKHIFRAGRLAKLRLRNLAPYLRPSASVLDIGASSGEWLYALSRAGYSACGIEANEGYAQFGRQAYGVDISIGSVFTAGWEGRRFDCVTMFHVLEHIPDPLALLRKIKPLTQPEGRLVIEVPHTHSVHQHPGKRFHYGHVIGFTPSALRFTIESAGWQLIELSVDHYSRNIWAVAQASENSSIEKIRAEQPLLADAQSIFRYYCRLSTYMRWGSRMAQTAREFLQVRNSLTPKEILEVALG
jgi:SAM-dependent methyltransferase